MTTYTINKIGLSLISKFLHERHVLGFQGFSDGMVLAWGAEAEERLNEGQPPVIELKSWQSVVRNTESFEVPDEGFDEVPAESETN